MPGIVKISGSYEEIASVFACELLNFPLIFSIPSNMTQVSRDIDRTRYFGSEDQRKTLERFYTDPAVSKIYAQGDFSGRTFIANKYSVLLLHAQEIEESTKIDDVSFAYLDDTVDHCGSKGTPCGLSISRHPFKPYEWAICLISNTTAKRCDRKVTIYSTTESEIYLNTHPESWQVVDTGADAEFRSALNSNDLSQVLDGLINEEAELQLSVLNFQLLLRYQCGISRNMWRWLEDYDHGAKFEMIMRLIYDEYFKPDLFTLTPDLLDLMLQIKDKKTLLKLGRLIKIIEQLFDQSGLELGDSDQCKVYACLVLAEYYLGLRGRESLQQEFNELRLSIQSKIADDANISWFDDLERVVFHITEIDTSYPLFNFLKSPHFTGHVRQVSSVSGNTPRDLTLDLVEELECRFMNEVVEAKIESSDEQLAYAQIKQNFLTFIFSNLNTLKTMSELQVGFNKIILPASDSKYAVDFEIAAEIAGLWILGRYNTMAAEGYRQAIELINIIDKIFRNEIKPTSKEEEKFADEYKIAAYRAICRYYGSDRSERSQKDLRQSITNANNKIAKPYLNNPQYSNRQSKNLFWLKVITNTISHVTVVGIIFNLYHLAWTGNYLFYTHCDVAAKLYRIPNAIIENSIKLIA